MRILRYTASQFTTTTENGVEFMSKTDIQDYICEKFSEHVAIERAVLFGEDLSLSMIILRSSKLRNSVDLMEAFAKTANALRKERGVRVRLPTLALDTPISKVLQVFLDEVQTAEAQATNVGI
jgi:hypothetical protein